MAVRARAALVARRIQVRIAARQPPTTHYDPFSRIEIIGLRWGVMLRQIPLTIILH